MTATERTSAIDAREAIRQLPARSGHTWLSSKLGCNLMEISNFDRRVLAIALGAGLLAVIGFALMLFDVWNGTKILTQVTVIAGIFA